MKNTASIKRMIALLLVAAMLFLTSCAGKTGGEESSTGETEPESVVTYSDTTENVTKSETVYVNLSSTGTPKKITVSDWLHADKSGVCVQDKTSLKNFSVTKGQASSVSDDGNITWQMGTSDVYYEGISDKELPISISIKYFLNDKEMTPEEIAGQSGNLRMEVTMKNNIKKEVTINGKKTEMYTPLVVAGGMVLSYENFSNIEVTNGLSIGGGSYEVVVLAGAPGLNESLNLANLNISGFEDFSFSDTFTITATVTDFSLGDTYYAAIPLSSLDLDIDLPKTLDDVKNVLNEVQDLQEILDRIDPNQVLTKFVTDGKSLKEMMDVMQKAVSLYQENEALLKVMSQYLTPENIETLSNFMSSLNTDQMQSLIGLLSNVPALQTLVDSLLKLSTGLSDVMPILEGVSEALKDPEVAKSLENLPETLDTIDELMNYLNENKEVLTILSNLMASDDMDALTGALDSMVEKGQQLGDTDVSELTGDAQELVERMDEWLKFDYSIYTDAPEYMKTSCMFICKTDPIKAAE